MRTANQVAAAGLGAVAVLVASVAGGDPWSSRPEAERQRPAAAADARTRERILRTYANLPLAFVENRGQTDSRVRYHAQGSRYGFFLTPEELRLAFRKGSDRPPGVALALRFLGGNPEVVLKGERRLPGEVNYLRGNDAARWRTGLRGYERIVYRELWPGVDLALRGRAGELKYEFRVRPRARPADIRLSWRGADGLRQDATGGLLIETALGVLRDSPPVAYQLIGGARVPVNARYVLNRGEDVERSYGFAVGRGYRPDRELIIDPGLAYSTFLGGGAHEEGADIAVDGSGNAYVTGFTQSPDFPTTLGAFDRTGAAGNNLDAFVSKLNATGSALVYSTFLGGSNFEWGRGLALDAAGNAYLAGQTKSSNFPTTGGAFDRTFNVDNCPRCGIDQYDAFVAKLNPSGSRLVFSTFLGGTDFDDAFAVAVDGAGNTHVAGQTGSTTFPTTSGAFDRSRNGSFDAFVTKLNATGSALVYSTLLGGADNELPAGIALDTGGNAYVGGGTRSANFPTTPGAFDTTQNGGAFDELFDGFVTKLNPTGSGLVYSTFLGGSKSDFSAGFAVDTARNAYVVGSTLSADFPTTPGSFDRAFAGSEGFVAKLNAAGSGLVYSTFLGEAAASAVTPDADGNAWLAGSTSSPTAATTPDASDRQFNGGPSDAYVAKLNATGSALLFATFLGGSDSEGAGDVALDSAGNVYVTGQTISADFPATAGAFDRVFNGDPSIFWGDAFVAKIAFGGGAPPPPPPPPPVPGAPALVSPADGAVVAQPVTFDWSDVAEAASYTIQVDEVSEFGAPLILSASATASQFTTSSLPDGNWFWRVRGVSSAGTPGAWSAVRAIQVQASAPPPPPPPGPLAAPSLLSPAHDARFSPGQSITFDWSDVSGAASYTIQIDDSESFSAPPTVSHTTSASSFTTSTLPTIRMWWRVRAHDASGAPGNWSSLRRFEVKD
jgi:Beta-propeller repeat